MSRPPKRLVFAGEAIVDLLMRVPALPQRGGDMLAESAAIEVGGGFNIMAAAVRQGLPVVYAGGHGTGPRGDKVRAALAGEGIGLLRGPDPDADTGFDVALVEGGGERTFVTALGAESLREPGAWDLIEVRAGDAVYVSGYGLVPPGSGRVEPHPRTHRHGGRHHGRGRRPLRGVPGRPGRRADRRRRRPPGQRGRRPDRHPGRCGDLTLPRRTRSVPHAFALISYTTVTVRLPGSTVRSVLSAALLVTVTVTTTYPLAGRDPADGETATLPATPAGTLMV